MQRYEYRVLETDIATVGQEDFTARLNAMGQQGWKLITSVSRERHGYSHEVEFVFSRPIEEDEMTRRQVAE